MKMPVIPRRFPPEGGIPVCMPMKVPHALYAPASMMPVTKQHARSGTSAWPVEMLAARYWRTECLVCFSEVEEGMSDADWMFVEKSGGWS